MQAASIILFKNLEDEYTRKVLGEARLRKYRAFHNVLRDYKHL